MFRARSPNEFESYSIRIFTLIRERGAGGINGGLELRKGKVYCHLSFTAREIGKDSELQENEI